MKNVSLILNIVLILAVAYLYILHFTSNDRGSNRGGASYPTGINRAATETEMTEGLTSGNIPKIAYVNSDTLLNQYDFFKTKRAELEKKAEGLQKDYDNRVKALQNEIANFQQNAGSMTINQAKAAEENLQKKQQNLLQYQQNLSQELMTEEGKVNDELYAKVSEYLKEMGQQQDFKLVLTYTKNSGVLYADDSLNITQALVQGLNEAYQQDSLAAD